MKLKNSLFVALLVVGFASNVLAESTTIADELMQLRRLNEASTPEYKCGESEKIAVELAEKFLSEKASSGSEGYDDISDAIHALKFQCEKTSKDS